MFEAHFWRKNSTSSSERYEHDRFAVTKSIYVPSGSGWQLTDFPAVIRVRRPTPSDLCRPDHDNVALAHGANIAPERGHRRTQDKFEKNLPDGDRNGREQQRAQPYSDA